MNNALTRFEKTIPYDARLRMKIDALLDGPDGAAERYEALLNETRDAMIKARIPWIGMPFDELMLLEQELEREDATVP